MKKFGFILLAVILSGISVTFAQGTTPTPAEVQQICRQLSAQNGTQAATVTHPQFGVYDCTTGLPANAVSGFTAGAASSTVSGSTSGEWQIEEVFGVEAIMRDVWIPGLLAHPIRPDLWQVFPNIPNDLVSEFRVVPCEHDPSQECTPDGLEYGEDLDIFCQQDVRCDFNVAARHYRLYTGDYDFPGVGESWHENGTGICGAIAVFNIGNVTAIFESQTFDRGFTVTGRSYNQDVLHMGMWGLMSHTAANMLNMTTMASPMQTLNQPNRTNAGANASNPEGCRGVNAVIVVISGNQVIFKARTQVFRSV